MKIIYLLIFILTFKCCSANTVVSLSKALREECFRSVQAQHNTHVLGNSTTPFCAAKFDGSCWPTTTINTTLSKPCPWLFFNETRNATAYCNATGYWKRTNYRVCQPLPRTIYKERLIIVLARLNFKKKPAVDPHIARHVLIYLTMQWISFCVILPATIALFFIPVNSNVKVFLHRNLVMAFLGSSVSFIVDYYTAEHSIKYKALCNTIWIFSRFFAVAEVSWMLNEGLYLLKLLLFTYDYKSYWRHLFIFGWGFPFILVAVIWLPIMNHSLVPFTQRCWASTGQSALMLIIYIPMTLMLVINFGILIYVIIILVRKLKKAPNGETRRIKKAVKGALLLVPLLGGIYMLVFYSPKGVTWYNYMLNVIQPMQGILVCVIHVYLDKEVRDSLRNRLRKLMIRMDWNAGYFTTGNTTKGDFSRATHHTKESDFSRFSRQPSSKESDFRQPSTKDAPVILLDAAFLKIENGIVNEGASET